MLNITLNITPITSITLIAAIANLFLGIVSYKKNKNNPINLSFALWGFLVFLHCLCMFFSEITTTGFIVIFWLKIAYSFLAFLPFAFINFIEEFVSSKKRKLLLFTLFVFGTIFSFLSLFTKLFIKGFLVRPWPYLNYPQAGNLYFFLPIIFIISVLIGSTKLLHEYHLSPGIRKNQIKYLLLAIIVGGGLASIEIICITFNINIPVISFIGVLLYSLIVAYAIVKHRLMDIEVVIKKSVIYSILIGLFTGIYIGSIFLFGEFIKNLTGDSYLILTILTIIIMAIGFQPLKNQLQDWIDRVFFRKKYNYQQTLKKLTTTVATIIDLKEVLQLTLNTLTATLQLKNSSALIYNKENKRFETKASINLSQESTNLTISSNYALIKALKEKKEPLLLEELQYIQSQEQKPELEPVILEMQKMETSFTLPLFAKNNLIGILNLGTKRSGDTFSNEDIDLLTTLSHNLAIAVENGRLHHEILQTQKKLFQADKLKSLGTIAAGIAHEIKNPLTSIKGLSQLVKTSHFENDEEFFNQFDDIVPRQLDRINYLVERLNQFSKPADMRRAITNINKLIEEALSLCENKCKKQEIEIIKELETLPTLSADPDQLHQVFTNLILNAIEAMPEGGKLKIKSRLFEKFKIIVEISDTGMGIAADKLGQIFDPFYTTKPSGTGLGLSIVHQIIEEHNGTIEALSTPQKATIFKITLKI